MSAKHTVSINPITIKDMVHNAIQCGVDYYKNKGAVMLTFQAGHLEPASTPGGFVGFRVALFSSPDGKHEIEGGWKRNNKKKVEALREKWLGEIMDKKGDGYEALKKFCTEKGFTLAETPEATTTKTPDAASA